MRTLVLMIVVLVLSSCVSESVFQLVHLKRATVCYRVLPDGKATTEQLYVGLQIDQYGHQKRLLYSLQKSPISMSHIEILYVKQPYQVLTRR